jgi:hypothetical protein
MNEIHVIESIVFPLIQDELETRLLDQEFPVFYLNSTVRPGDNTSFVDSNTKDYPLFTHTFIKDGEVNSESYALIKPIVDSFLMRFPPDQQPKLERCRLNVTYPNREFEEHNYLPPHYDLTRKTIVCLYYVNDSDGDTLFFEKPEGSGNQIDGTLTITDQYTPKKGNMLYFDESVLHSNKPPRTTRARVVINFNFIL